MKGSWIVYSAEEMAWLEANRTLPISDYHAGFCAAFRRDDVSAGNLHALRKRRGWRTGRTGKFEPGSVPANKGTTCPPGVGVNHPNAVATRFSKGNRSGRAVELYKPIGTERVSKEGYRERKIHDGMPLQSRWRMVHLVEWEAVNGPIPAGHCLKCLTSDKLNTDPSNWVLIERAIMPALNGGRHKRRLAYDEASPEVRPTLMALAQVERRAHKLRKAKA